MQEKKTRYYLIDGVRGFTVISMIIYHFLYDVFMIYGKNTLWVDSLPVQFWQQTICWSFIFISGFTWPLGSAGNLRRGIRLNLYGLIISLVTAIIIPSEAIWFGILNFMGCAVLLMFPLQKILSRLSGVQGFILSFFLFILCRQIPNGRIGVGELFQIHLPPFLYSTKLFTPLGFPFDGFYSSDYFPVLPWIFWYLCGYFGSRIFMKDTSFQRIACSEIPVLSKIGKNTIWIYLLHQPVNLLVCFLLFNSN